MRKPRAAPFAGLFDRLSGADAPSLTHDGNEQRLGSFGWFDFERDAIESEFSG
jgi:hypothetical protein